MILKDLKKKLWVKNELGDYMKCPKCGSEMVKRNGKYGEFLSCSGFPDCKYSCDLDGSKNTFDKIKHDANDFFGECPKCGSPLVKREGKYGEFLSCSGFPDCNYSCDLDGSKNTFDRLNTGKYDDGICPNCGSPLVNKKGKFGEFLSCTRYPSCKYSRDL